MIDSGTSTFTSPAGPFAFSTLVQSAGSTYTLTDKDGNKSHFSSTGLLTSRVDTSGSSTKFAFVDADSDGETDDLSAVTDPWGRVTTFAYSGGLLASISDHAERVTAVAHDGQGRITSITAPDPDGTGPLASPVTSYSYSGSTRKLATITDPLGHVTTIAS